MLLQQLIKLTEGRVKEAIMDIIEIAVNYAPIGNASYEKALDIIVRFAKKADYQEVLSGCSDDELKEYVKGIFTEEDYELDESVNEESEVDNPPEVIAKAGDFILTLDAETEQVTLSKGEAVVAEMPLVIWKQLKRQ